MLRRPVNASRCFVESGGIPLAGALNQRSRTSSLLSIGLVLLGTFLLIWYSYSGSGGFIGDKEALSRFEGVPCTVEVHQAVPILKKAYGDSMHKVLHVGPETCSVVSKLLKEEETKAWGVEPYDLEDADSRCKSLVRRGSVRVADIKFPLPYGPNSFSLVIVSDALDYLSPKYLNKTLRDLARVSKDGLVIFAGYPCQQRAKLSELPKFGRPVMVNLSCLESELQTGSLPDLSSMTHPPFNSDLTKTADIVPDTAPGPASAGQAKLRSYSWWIRYFVQTGLEENEAAMKKFEHAANKWSYKPCCQVFHLSP